MLANRRQRSIKCSGALDVDDPSHELEPEISVKRDCPQAFYADCAQRMPNNRTHTGIIKLGNNSSKSYHPSLDATESGSGQSQKC